MKGALFALVFLAATSSTIPKPVITATVPVTVNVPSSVTTPEQARPFFDAFSWQSFIALNWPAANPTTQRNVPLNPNDPNTFLNLSGRKTPVWMTWKQSWELFGQRPPTPWTSFSDPQPPCGGSTSGADTLVRSAKAGSYLDDVNQALSYPLIDQHLGYVFYEVRYNQAQYNFVFNNKYYLQSNLGKAEPVVMPMSKPYSVGAIMVKAAWKVMTKADDQSRYFVTNAQVYDPIAKQCSNLAVGLVGFHIAQKADGFAEWIWSTFEQVDNVPDPNVTKPPQGWSFNNGTNNPKTQGGWANRPNYKSPNLVPISQRTAVQVTRLNPIPVTPPGASTVDVNKVFQQALAKTPWRYYELVFTQWPTSGEQASFHTQGATVSPGVTATYEKNCGNPFPLYDVTNAALETYVQSRTDAFSAGGNSCMQCHYVAGAADFSWGLFRRAHP
jgi:hypothetical protein